MRRGLWVAAGIVSLLLPSAARGMWADIPLEIIAAQSDLVLVGKAVEVGEPQEMRLHEPGRDKPAQTWFRICRVKVTKLIHERDAAPRDKAVPWIGRTISLVTRAPKPQPAGPGGPFGPLILDGPFYANLKPGARYVMILRKMKGGTAWYLPDYFKNVRPESDEWVKQVTRAAHVEKWNWGKAVGGMQIALMTNREQYTLGVSIIRDPNGRQRRVTQIHAQMTIALRNTSGREIAVGLYAEDRYLSVKATGAGGKVVNVDFYSRLKRMDMRAFGAWATKRIAPGGILFIGPMGEAKYGLGQGLELSPGKWTLSAGHKNKRPGGEKGNKQEGEPDMPKLWTGEIVSADCEITVAAPRRR